MKKLVCILVVLLTSLSFAQNGINYKALIKDNLGNVAANSSVTILFAILEGSGQTNVYQETHTTTTDANGIIIVNIGEGSQVFGNYSTIDWGSDDHFLDVLIDIGNGWVDMGITQFMAVPYALHALNATNATNAMNVTGLEAIDEGHGIGWRLKGRDPDNYAIIGWGAIDLSNSSFASTTLGAHGDFSAAFGDNTEASGVVSFASGYGSKALGQYSTAQGYSTTANGIYSTTIGNQTFASGENSTAMGYGTNADGISSTAMGYFTYSNGSNSTSMGSLTEAIGTNSIAMGLQTNADAINSTAMGNQSRASGDNSTAMGYNTLASNFASTSIGNTTVATGNGSTSMGFSTSASGNYSTAMGTFTRSQAFANLSIGRYNVGSGTSTSWINTDPLFEIGNGTADNSRSNALTVLKNGNVGIGKGSGINGRVEIASASGLTSPQLYIHETTGSYSRINFSNATRSDYWAVGAYIGATSASDQFNIYNSSVGADIMSIRGNGTVYVNGAVVHSSDSRLKKDITPIPYGLKEVLQLQPKSYNWKTRESEYKSLGLIAQELQPIIKELVYVTDEDTQMLSVNYTELIPILIKAMQEQQEIIDTQSKTIFTQDSKINTLTTELDQLKTLDARVEQLEALLKTFNQ